MPKTYRATKPYLLGQNDNMAQGEALYDATLTGDTVYEAFDMCELVNGALRKIAVAPVAATRLCIANTDWQQPFATAIYRARQAWYRRMAPEDVVIFQLAPAFAEAVRGQQRDLAWNNTDKVLEIAATSANPKVQLLYPIFELNYATDPGTGFESDQQRRPEVGDLKVPYAVRFVSGATL